MLNSAIIKIIKNTSRLIHVVTICQKNHFENFPTIIRGNTYDAFLQEKTNTTLLQTNTPLLQTSYFRSYFRSETGWKMLETIL